MCSSITVCHSCNTEIEAGNKVDNHVVCDDCLDENYFTCPVCDKRCDNDDSREDYQNDRVCSACFDKTCVACVDCDKIIDINTETEDNFSNTVCQSCFDKNYFTCSDCGCIENQDSRCTDNDGDEFCEDCYGNRYTVCQCCDEEISVDDELCSNCESNHEYCSECNERFHVDELTNGVCESCEEDYIQSYSYKPPVIFHGKGPYYLGVEIEVIPTDSRVEAARNVKNTMGRFVYLKNDSSLEPDLDKDEDFESGFEIVSHPASLDYHKENWSKLLDKVKEIGISSYPYECCGTHVHISRKNLSELTIGKIVNFINSDDNREFIINLAQRESVDYASLDEKPISYVKKYDKKRDERYNSVNLLCTNTIELRIFKGNLSKRILFRTLEFCEAIQLFCKNSSTRDLTYKSFIEFVSKNKKRYNNLHEFCKNFNK